MRKHRLKVMEFYEGATISYLNTDDAGQCGRGRRILSLRYPSKIIGKCWAHQVNLMVKYVLTLAGFIKIMKEATSAANAISASSNKWLVKLKQYCVQRYGDKAASTILQVGETRWNSLQMCFASMLRIRGAAQNFAFETMHFSGFPKECKVWADEQWWSDLEFCESVIRPLCSASFLMQREANTLAHVVLMLMNIWLHLYNVFEITPHIEYKLMDDLQRRWRKDENPLYFLAFALHPAYRTTAAAIIEYSERENGNWVSKGNCLSVARLTHAAKFYYGKFQLTTIEEFDTSEEGRTKCKGRRQWEQEIKTLGKNMKKWLTGKNMTGIQDDYATGEDAVEWWVMQSSEYPEMAELAMFLLDCPVQAATCERIFKEFSRFHTKRRANLINETTFRLTQVKHAIKKEFKKDEQALPGNKVMKQQEHVRIDTPLSPVRGGRREKDDADLSDGEVDWEVASVDQTGEELLEEETDVVEYWTAAIEAGGDDDDSEEEDNENEMENDHKEKDEEDLAEESYLCYEEQLDDEDLDKWPEQKKGEEDKAYRNWPQENPK